MATSPDAKPGLGHPQPCVLDWQGEPCEPCAALSKPQDGDGHVVAFPGPPGEKGEPGPPGFGLPGKQVSFGASGVGMQTGLKTGWDPISVGLLAPWAVGSRW